MLYNRKYEVDKIEETTLMLMIKKVGEWDDNNNNDDSISYRLCCYDNSKYEVVNKLKKQYWSRLRLRFRRL